MVSVIHLGFCFFFWVSEIFTNGPRYTNGPVAYFPSVLLTDTLQLSGSSLTAAIMYVLFPAVSQNLAHSPTVGAEDILSGDTRHALIILIG